MTRAFAYVANICLYRAPAQLLDVAFSIPLGHVVGLALSGGAPALRALALGAPLLALVISLVGFGANAVPIPSAKAQQIAERVKAQRRGIRVSFGHNAFACPIQPPLVTVGMNALSKDGLTMLFFAHVAEHQGGTGGQRQEAKVLVDSGATHCYVSEAFVRRHGFQKMEQVSTSLRLATGALVLKQLGSVLSR